MEAVINKRVAGHEARRREDATRSGFRSERRKILAAIASKRTINSSFQIQMNFKITNSINSEPRGVERRGGRDRKGGGVSADTPSLS